MRRTFAIFILTLVFITALIGGGYFGYQTYLQLEEQKFALETEKASLEDDLKASQKEIGIMNEVAARLIEARDDFAQKYADQKQRADDIELQLTSTRDTIKVLAKLDAVDPELLKKYSKVYFLSENYAPEKLSKIDEKYIDETKDELLLLDGVLPHLNDLMSAAETNEVDLKVISAYRSFGTQSTLKSAYTVMYGSGANRFSADQGYSEHQLGTAVDFTNSEMGSSLQTTFKNTEAYEWLAENAHKYGFILSYPEGNNYYQFEPWHWRFIGTVFASRLHEEERVFYELDQRIIDTYLLSFFD